MCIGYILALTMTHWSFCLKRKTKRKLVGMRKIIAVLLSAMMILVICSCGNKTNAPQAAQQGNAADGSYDTIDNAFATNAVKYRVPAMAVMEVSSDEILFSGCYGECTGPDQDFIIGSLSKSFTAVAIMQLSEKGVVDLESSITEYIDCGKFFKDDPDKK